MVILPFYRLWERYRLGTSDRAWYCSGTGSPVPVPDFTGGSGTGAKFSSSRVLVQIKGVLISVNNAAHVGTQYV